MKKVLVVVDYQKDFVDGALGFEEAVQLEKPILELVEHYIDNNDNIIFTLDTHREDYLNTREGKNLPIPHCLLNSDGWKLYGKLKEYTPKKYPFLINAFCKYNQFGFNENADVFSDTINYDNEEDIEFTICGLVTNLCVLSVGVSLQNMYPNSTIIIDAECCASFDNDLHEKALDIMEGLQFKVINR